MAGARPSGADEEMAVEALLARVLLLQVSQHVALGLVAALAGLNRADKALVRLGGFGLGDQGGEVAVLRVLDRDVRFEIAFMPSAKMSVIRDHGRGGQKNLEGRGRRRGWESHAASSQINFPFYGQKESC